MTEKPKCETCESFRDQIITERKTTCTWTHTRVYPGSSCICSPSHHKEFKTVSMPEKHVNPGPASLNPVVIDDSYRSAKSSAPAEPEKILLCFGSYWECPIDEEECKESDICHQRAIQNREHDATIRNQTLDEEIHRTLSVVRNTIERYEDDETATIEDALDDIRHHLEGRLIEVQEKQESPRTPNTQDQQHERGDQSE